MHIFKRAVTLLIIANSTIGTVLYRCPYTCSYRTQKKADITTHMRIHTGERPFTCSDSKCSKTFTTSSNCRRHEKKIHDIIKQKKKCKKATIPKVKKKKQKPTIHEYEESNLTFNINLNTFFNFNVLGDAPPSPNSPWFPLENNASDNHTWIEETLFNQLRVNLWDTPQEKKSISANTSSKKKKKRKLSPVQKKTTYTPATRVFSDKEWTLAIKQLLNVMTQTKIKPASDTPLYYPYYEKLKRSSIFEK